MVSLYKNELEKIEKSLDESLITVETDDTSGRYEVHRMAFNELMKIVKVYGPILSSIKTEYESLISHVHKTVQYSRTMDEELRTACSYPITIVNYERKCAELRIKLQKQRRSNDHRLERVRDVQLKCQSIQRAMENVTAANENEGDREIGRAHKEKRRQLPCMSLESMTDLSTMQTMHDQLAAQRLHMQRSMATKYVARSEQTQLESQLKDQIVNYDNVRQEVRNLIRRKFLLESAQARVHSLDDGHGAFAGNIGEVILSSLIGSARSMEAINEKSDEDSVEEEINRYFPESSKPIGSMKESDYIVLCIRQFEKLFRDGKYREAADLAVISPRGVLRNYATMLKFKEVGGSDMLHYCKQVIATMTSGHLDPDMSYECVDIALKEGRIDLVNLWISKGRLQSTELIADNLTCHADLIPDHKIICFDLAASIYLNLLSTLSTDETRQAKGMSSKTTNSQWFTSRRKYFDSILECRIKSGRIEEAVEMLCNENSTPVSARSVGMMYKADDLLLLVQYYPNIELVHSLIKKDLLSLESVFNSLLESESYGTFVNLLVKTMETYNNVSKVLDLLCTGVVNGISTEVWERVLNFVDESSEKMIMEIAASYLVRISLERSCLALNSLGLDV